MEEKRGKYVPATVDDTSFSCPHCGTFTSQTWFIAYGIAIRTNEGTPKLQLEADLLTQLKIATSKSSEDLAELQQALSQAGHKQKLIDGQVFMTSPNTIGSQTKVRAVYNVHYSLCYSCAQVSIWHQDRLLFPEHITAPDPNEGMPEDVKHDYLEAASILAKSPRGAAALLRLAVEKICHHLGYETETINDAIKDMVKKGLNEKIQKALDSVRVVGNECVHPGELDMKDNHAVATKLFSLINIIIQDRITGPKQIDDFYEDFVPENKRDAITKRDKKKDDAS